MDNSQQIRNLLAYSVVVEEEYVSACEAKRWMAALTIGCSLLECLLLMRTISSIAQVSAHAKYIGTASDKICGRGWGLKELTNLALDMGWLDPEFVDPMVRDAIVNLVRSAKPNIGTAELSRALAGFLIHASRMQRNTVHPGVIARQKTSFSKQHFLESAEYCCSQLDIAIRCLRETQNLRASR